MYGSYAPDAPQDVFIDDGQFQQRWRTGDRYYVVAEDTGKSAFRETSGQRVAAYGGGERREVSVYESGFAAVTIVLDFLFCIFSKLRPEFASRRNRE